jgi:hypothetical protein
MGSLVRCFLCFTVLNFSDPAYAACNIVGDKAYGDCSGVTINRQPQPYKIVIGFEVLGGIAEGATVKSGGSLLSSGIVEKIEIERGGTATISGIASIVINHGGNVNITGQVGQLLAMSGVTTIEGTVDSVFGRSCVAQKRFSCVGHSNAINFLKHGLSQQSTRLVLTPGLRKGK